jgi:ribosome-associated protein
MRENEIAPDPHDPEESLPPSKSQRKRDATALQNLGERLVKLTPAQLKRIPLPDDVLAAVRMAQTISQRGGRKRQLQYIGKLMRQIDDPDAIRAALRAVLPGQDHGRNF